MVVQAFEHNEESVEFIKIPEGIPKEIIENDSLLTIESNLNKLEDKLVITARSAIGLTNEMKIQLFEIERLEKTILSMHEYMVRQNSRIIELENQVIYINSKVESHHKNKGFWSKIFS